MAVMGAMITATILFLLLFFSVNSIQFRKLQQVQVHGDCSGFVNGCTDAVSAIAACLPPSGGEGIQGNRHAVLCTCKEHPLCSCTALTSGGELRFAGKLQHGQKQSAGLPPKSPSKLGSTCMQSRLSSNGASSKNAQKQRARQP